MKTLYTAEALATGEGRDGHGRTSDGTLDFDLAIPKEMGGSGNGTNPERRRSREAWETWWQASGGKADLARLKQEEPYRGLTLVCEYDGGPANGRYFTRR